MPKYPIGAPLWRVFGRMGAPLALFIETCFDRDANVFTASSVGIRGFILEAKSEDELRAQAASNLPAFLGAPQGMHGRAEVFFRGRGHGGIDLGSGPTTSQATIWRLRKLLADKKWHPLPFCGGALETWQKGSASIFFPPAFVSANTLLNILEAAGVTVPL